MSTNENTRLIVRVTLAKSRVVEGYSVKGMPVDRNCTSYTCNSSMSVPQAQGFLSPKVNYHSPPYIEISLNQTTGTRIPAPTRKLFKI
jgi:hypothetical protein